MISKGGDDFWTSIEQIRESVIGLSRDHSDLFCVKIYISVVFYFLTVISTLYKCVPFPVLVLIEFIDSFVGQQKISNLTCLKVAAIAILNL